MAQEIKLKVALDTKDLKKLITVKIDVKKLSSTIDAALAKLTAKPIDMQLDVSKSFDKSLSRVKASLAGFMRNYSGQLASITDEGTQAGDRFDLNMRHATRYGAMAVSAYAGLEIILSKIFNQSGQPLLQNLDAISGGLNDAAQSGNTFLNWFEDLGIVGQDTLQKLAEYLDTIAVGISGSISDLTLSLAKLFPPAFSFILGQIQSVISMFKSINVGPFLTLLGITSPTMILISNTLVKALAFRGTMMVFTTAFGLFKDFANFLFPKLATIKDALTGIGNIAVVLNNMFTVRVATFMGWIKTIGATVATGFSWFLGLPGMVTTVLTGLIVKSGVSILREKLTRFLMGSAANLGSARAQLVLIALNLKDIALPVTNMMYALIKSKGIIEGISGVTKGLGQNSSGKIFNNVTTFLAKLIDAILKKLSITATTVKTMATSALSNVGGTLTKYFSGVGKTIWYTITSPIYAFFIGGELAEYAVKGMIKVGAVVGKGVGNLAKSAFSGLGSIGKTIFSGLWKKQPPEQRTEQLIPPKSLIPPGTKPLSFLEQMTSKKQYQPIQRDITLAIDSFRRQFPEYGIVFFSRLGEKLVKDLQAISKTGKSDIFKGKSAEKATQLNQNLLKVIKEVVWTIVSKIPMRDVSEIRGEYGYTKAQREIVSKYKGGKLPDKNSQAYKESLQPISLLAELKAKYVAWFKGMGSTGGKGFGDEFQKGIIGGIPKLRTSLLSIGFFVRRFFPHSPADEGPLVGLRTWGAHILDELSFGIMSQAISFKDSLFALSNRIAESIKPILEMGHIADRVGVSVEAISQLQHALIGYDVTVQDLQMTFNSLKSTIQSINDDAKISTLANVGIDLDKVRAAADPTLELFYQLADAAQKFPLSSLQMKNALEALGINIQSNLVNALAMGRDQILAMMSEANVMGATVDESFIKIGFTFSETLAKLNKLWSYLEKEFIAQILPYIDSINKKLLSIYEDNAPKIRALVRIAGQVFEQILKMVSNIIKTAWANPDQIMDFVMGVIVGVWGAIKAYLKAALTDATQGMTYYGLAFIKTLVMSTWEIAKEYGSLAWTLAYGRIMDIFTTIETKAYSLLKKFSDSVFGRAWLSDSAREVIDKLNEQAIAGQEDAVVQMYQAVEASNMRVNYIVKGAQKEVEQAVLGMMDEDVQKQSIERFANAGKEAKAALQGIYTGTVFEEPIVKAIENIQKAVSDANFKAVKQDIEDGIQTISIDVEEKINQPIQHLQGTLTKVADAANKGKDNIVGMMEAAQRDTRIRNLFADMESRLDESGDAQNKKALLDLKNKQTDELKSLKEMLAAKYKLGLEEATQHTDFLKFKAQQEREYNLTVSKQDKQRLMNQSQMISDSFGNFSSAINTVYEETGKRHKALFYMSKALALSQAIINTALAVVNAFAQGGPFLGPALGAMAGAAGAVQIGVIMAQTFKGFNKGGLVYGRDIGNKDSVAASLTVGEYVIPRNVVSKYGISIMEALRGGIIPKAALAGYSMPKAPNIPPNLAFNSGGYVKGTGSTTNATIVNVVDPNLLDSLLATTQGKNSILNVITANASTIRHSLALA